MDEPLRDEAARPRILLATDLSSRCDRAFDRAVQLAGAWQAELVVVSVLEAPQSPDLVLAWAEGGDDASRVGLARRQIGRDLAGKNVQARIVITRGEPTEVIGRTADSLACGLVLTGMARNEACGRFLAGSTVESLARSLRVPMLVVRERVHDVYRGIVVATDFSETSGKALREAATRFPEHRLTLFHAETPPFSGFGKRTDSELAAREIPQQEHAEFLAASGLTAEDCSRVRIVVARGAVETALTRYVREHGIELVVFATRGWNALVSVLLGSTAVKLLDWLPCDTLVVPVRTGAS